MYYFIRVGVLSGFTKLLADYGIQTSTLLRELDLPVNLFDDDDRLIEISSIQILLDRASELSNCPHLGIQLANNQPLSFLGIIGLIMQSSSNMVVALKKCIQYHNIHAQGISWSLEIEGDYAYMRFNQGQLRQQVSVQSQGFTVAQVNKVICLLSEKECRPMAVHFHFEQPQDTLFYRQTFATKLFFNADFDGLIYKVSDLLKPLKTQNDYLNKILTDLASQLSEGDSIEFVPKVRKVIQQLLPSGRCSIDSLAQVFNCHKRTLQRRLKVNNISFTSIRDEERFQISCKYLKSSVPMIIIADLVGFSDISTFSRAFKTRFGMSPSKWRQLQLR